MAILPAKVASKGTLCGLSLPRQHFQVLLQKAPELREFEDLAATVQP